VVVSAVGSKCAAVSVATGCRLYLSDENTGQVYISLKSAMKVACPEAVRGYGDGAGDS
jgi:hypothetical protein